MGKVIFYLLLLVLLGISGLYGYSFVLTTEQAPITQEIDIALD